MTIPKVLVFAGSVRSGSFNRQLAEAAAKVLALKGADVTMLSLADYPMPILDQNLEKEKGAPDNAIRLARMFAAHDAAFIASPEYNASIPPLLKNTLDWISRVRQVDGEAVKPFEGLTVALGAASNGRLGGIRALYHLRAVMMALRTQVVSEQCSIHFAGEAFGEDGMPADETAAGILDNACRSLLDHCTPGRGR